MAWAPEIPIWVSLSFILGTLAVATIASLVKTRNDDAVDRAVDSDRPAVERELSAAPWVSHP